MSPWKSSTAELPPVGLDVVVVVIGDGSLVYAVASVAESDSGDSYWESSDDMVHGLSCDDPDDAVLWMKIPPLPSDYSMDGKTSHG